MAVKNLTASAAVGSTSAAVEPMSAVSHREIQELVECPICFSRLEAAVDPRALPCLHTFCRKCLVSYQTSLKNGRRRMTKLPCPFCRREATLPPSGIAGLPRNFLACQISDALRRSSAPERALVTSQNGPQRERVQPSAPALSDVTSAKRVVIASAPSLSELRPGSDVSPAENMAAGRPTVTSVQMRRQPGDPPRASQPRPSSDPLLASLRPEVDIPPRKRFGPVASYHDEEEDYSWGTLGRRRKKDKPSFMATMLGSFLSATR